MDLIHVELHISAPRIHEHYHADWTRRTVEADRQWNTMIPLLNQGSIVGRIRISGEVTFPPRPCITELVAELISGLKPTELQIEELLNQTTATVLPPVSSEAA